MTKTAAERAELVRAWRSSGQTAKHFAEQRGVPLSTLTWWARELKRRGGQESLPATSIQKGPILARVVTRERTDLASEESIAVEVGRVRVVVRHGFDAALLRNVVRALAEAT